MTASSRAFAGAALLWLVLAALLHVLAVFGVVSTWGAMVHTMLFGWATGMITAVNYHTMPVFAARDFPSRRMIWAHWFLFVGGVPVAVTGMLGMVPALAVAGMTLELAAALMFLTNVVQLLRRGQPRPRAAAPAIRHQPQIDRLGTQATKVSGLCLPLALGLLLGARLGWHGEWVLAAEHLAALGWVMLMIVGVGYHVLPRFSGHGVRGLHWARAQLVCQIGALVLLIVGLGFGWSTLFALGGVLMAVALGLFGWVIWPTLRPLTFPNSIGPIVNGRR